MTMLDEHAKRLCAVCGQPFYDPEQGVVKEYRYTMRYVSDAHREMFHSGNERDPNYDPDYYAAIGRREKQRQAREEELYSRLHYNRPAAMERHERALERIKREQPKIRPRRTTDADHRPAPEPDPHP